MAEPKADAAQSASRSDVARTLGLAGRGPGRRRWLTLAAIVAVVLAVGAYVLFLRQGDSGPHYATTPAVMAPLTVTVTANGTIEPTNRVAISSELSGTLATVSADFNDVVAVGQVLATLDTTKLDAQRAVARASLDAAIARVSMADASLEEARALYEAGVALDERGITSPQAFMSRRAAYSRAQAERQIAMADRTLAEANLDLIEADLGKARIVSPIRGVVLDRTADAGQIVASSLSAPVLFTLAEDLTEMELRVDVDEADIGRIGVGNRAEFTVEAYSGRHFPAAITEVRYAAQTIAGVVTYQAVLTVDNSDMALRPGMTAIADIVVAEFAQALIVPNAALRYAPPAAGTPEAGGFVPPPQMMQPTGKAGGNPGTVWVLRDGTAVEIAVETGDSDGRVTQILSGDLAAGDAVVTGTQTRG